MKDTNRINKIKRFNESFDDKNSLLEKIEPLFHESEETELYTEKEVLRMLNNYDREFKLDTFAYTKPCKYTVEDWFERNKK